MVGCFTALARDQVNKKEDPGEYEGAVPHVVQRSAQARDGAQRDGGQHGANRGNHKVRREAAQVATGNGPKRAQEEGQELDL